MGKIAFYATIMSLVVGCAASGVEYVAPVLPDAGAPDDVMATTSCTPGVVQSCPCSGGGPNGTQTCNGTGSAFGRCNGCFVDAGPPIDMPLLKDSGLASDVGPRPTDPCNDYASCGACTLVNGCGWCDGRCVSGASSGPASGACASPWVWVSAGCSGDAGATRDVGPSSDTGALSCVNGNLGSAIGAGVARGTTTGRASSNTPPVTCVSNMTVPSPDAVFAWTAPTSGTYTFDTLGSGYDTVLTLRSAGCDGPTLACSDDIAMGTLESRITTPLTAGQTIIISVDGYNGASGPFTLNVTGGSAADAGVPCTSGTLSCGGRCVDVSSDVANCGGCGVTCTTRCTLGRCAPPTWTVFVYANADHNLSPSLVTDLEEMSRATLGANVNVVVMADWDSMMTLGSSASTWARIAPLAAQTGGTRFPNGTQWFHVIGSGRPLELVRSAAEQDVDDPSVMAEAIRTAFTLYPADRYGVVFWDHGGSWTGGFGGDSQNRTRSAASSIGAPAIATAIRSGLSRAGVTRTPPLEFIAFDACLMGAVEVVSPLSTVAKVFLGEAELDFAAGWDYAGALTWLGSNPGATAQEFGREEVRLWGLHHRTLQTDVLFRSKIALDLTRWSRFEGAIRSFADTLLAGGMMSAEAFAREAYLTIPTYGSSSDGAGTRRPTDGYRDAAQFLTSISLSAFAAPPLRTAASTAASALRDITLATSQGSFRGTMYGQGGLQFSMPLPINVTPAYRSDYQLKAADWAIATRWTEVFSATVPSGPWPVITHSILNGTDPTASRLPQVLFSAAGTVVEAEVRITQADLAYTDSGGRWINYGPLLQSTLQPGVGYSAIWDGRIRALPTPSGGVQSITTDWYIRAFEPGSGRVLGMMATPGVCGLGTTLISCDLVFRTDTGAVDVVVFWTAGGNPSAFSFAELAAPSIATFTPYVRTESNTSVPLPSIRGTTIVLTPGLTVRLAAVNSGLYEMQTHVTDVYGRETSTQDFVSTRAPFAF